MDGSAGIFLTVLCLTVCNATGLWSRNISLLERTFCLGCAFLPFTWKFLSSWWGWKPFFKKKKVFRNWHIDFLQSSELGCICSRGAVGEWSAAGSPRSVGLQDAVSRSWFLTLALISPVLTGCLNCFASVITNWVFIFLGGLVWNNCLWFCRNCCRVTAAAKIHRSCGLNVSAAKLG